MPAFAGKTSCCKSTIYLNHRYYYYVSFFCCSVRISIPWCLCRWLCCLLKEKRDLLCLPGLKLIGPGAKGVVSVQVPARESCWTWMCLRTKVCRLLRFCLIRKNVSVALNVPKCVPILPLAFSVNRKTNLPAGPATGLRNTPAS